MKKLIIFLLFTVICIGSFAKGGGHASGHASAHVSSHAESHITTHTESQVHVNPVHIANSAIDIAQAVTTNPTIDSLNESNQYYDQSQAFTQDADDSDNCGAGEIVFSLVIAIIIALIIVL